MMSKKIWGIISGVLLALFAMALIVGLPTKVNADGGEHENHCICGGNCETATKANGHTCATTAPTWTAVSTYAEFTAAFASAAQTELTDYYVYLTADITATGSRTIYEKTRVHICLNGHKIVGKNASRVFMFSSSGAELTICDCQYDYTKLTGGSIVTGTKLTGSQQGQAIFVQNTIGNEVTSKLDVFGGTISGGETSSNYGGNIAINNGGIFNFYGGTITDGTSGTYGGNVGFGASCTFNMYGGTIDGGTSGTYGGNVGVSSSGKFNMYGGTITGGTSGTYGGNVSLAVNGTLKMYGGTISDGSSTSYGGNIAVSGSDSTKYSTAQISGGTISGGKTKTYGGNISLAYGKLTVSDGVIENGYSEETDSDQRGGGNISVASGTLTLYGGIIRNGSTAGAPGGNIYLKGGAANIYGVGSNGIGMEISGGQSPSYGGNIAIAGESAGNGTASLSIYGGNFTGGTAPQAANIYIRKNDNANALIYGGIFEGGVHVENGGVKCYGGVYTAEAGADPLTKSDTGVIAVECGWSTSPMLYPASGFSAISVEGAGAAKYTVSAAETDAVAKITIGETSWYAKDMTRAFDAAPTVAAENGATAAQTTIQLLADCAKEYTIRSGKNIVLDLNGHSIKATSGNSEKNVISICGGTFKIVDTSLEGTGCVDGEGKNRPIYLLAGDAENMGSFTLESGTIQNGARLTASGGSIFAYDGYTINIAGGLITGGTTGFSTDGAHTVKKTDARGGNIYVSPNCTLNVTGGKITNGVATGNGGNIVISEDSEMLVTGGEILDGYSKSGNGYNVAIYGTVTVNNGTIGGKGTYNGATSTTHSFVTQSSKAKVYINGGTFTSTVQCVSGGSTFDITAGMFETSVYVYNSDTVISGGTFLQTVNVGNEGHLTITGGEFSTKPYLVSGKTGTVLIQGGNYVLAPAQKYLDEGLLACNKEQKIGEITYYYTVGEGFTVSTDSEAVTGAIPYAANVIGGGNYLTGTEVTLTAPEVANYAFLGWYDGATLVSSEKQYPVTVNKDYSLTAVYEYGSEDVGFAVSILSTTGTLQVKVGDGVFLPVADGSFEEEIAGGTTVTMQLTGATSFIGWTNQTSKLVSRETTYSFVVCDAMSFTAWDNEASATQLVMYLSDFDQVLSITAASEAAPEAPARIGMTFKEWTTVEDATNSMFVVKKAVYEAASDEAKVVVKTIVSPDGDEKILVSDADQNFTAKVSGTITVTMPATYTYETTEYTFFAFAADQETTTALGFTSTLKFKNADTTERVIYAVYIPADQMVPARPVVTITLKNLNDTKASIVASRAIPENMELVSQGFVMTSAKLLTEDTLDAATDALVLGNGTTARTLVSSGTDKIDTTSLNLSGITDTKIYLRAYVVYKEADGAQGVIYSDVVTVSSAGIE